MSEATPPGGWRYHLNTALSNVERREDNICVGRWSFVCVANREGFGGLHGWTDRLVAAMYERARDDLLGRGLIEDAEA
jgi:hypothetical protein